MDFEKVLERYRKLTNETDGRSPSFLPNNNRLTSTTTPTASDWRVAPTVQNLLTTSFQQQQPQNPFQQLSSSVVSMTTSSSSSPSPVHPIFGKRVGEEGIQLDTTTTRDKVAVITSIPPFSTTSNLHPKSKDNSENNSLNNKNENVDSSHVLPASFWKEKLKNLMETNDFSYPSSNAMVVAPPPSEESKEKENENDDNENENENENKRNTPMTIQERESQRHTGYMPRQEIESNIRHLLESMTQIELGMEVIRKDHQLLLQQLDFIKQLIGVDDTEIEYDM
jgi:hypothetical protein